MSPLELLKEFCKQLASEHESDRLSGELEGRDYGYADGSEDAYLNVLRKINQLEGNQ